MKRNYLGEIVSFETRRSRKEKYAYRLYGLAEAHLVRKHTIGVMVPLVRDPICTFNLVLTYCVALLEAVRRCVGNAIGRSFGTGRKPQVGVWDFLKTVKLLNGSIIFDI
jgi:hypothetical protein